MQKLKYVVNAINGGFVVYEIATRLIVKRCSSYTEAKRIAKKLDRGLGFNGWTPAFLTEKFPIFENQ